MAKHYSLYKARRGNESNKGIKSYIPMRYACIYEIRCIVNDRIYIGQTHDLTLRWNQHIAGNIAAQTFGHLTAKKLIADVEIHGIENFTFRILKRCFALTNEEREALEQKYIHELNPYYNAKK